MEKKILEKAGFSKGEIEVYLMLLKCGNSKVSAIAQFTGLHRTNIYDILEKLLEKGIVSYVIENDTKIFSAASANKILDYLNERSEEVKSIIPDLDRFSNYNSGQSVVEIFKGKEGLKTVLRDIIHEKKPYCVFEENGTIERVLPNFYPQFNKLLSFEKIPVMVLTNEISSVSKRSLMQIRKLPKFVSFPSATAIYGDKVVIFVWDEPYYAFMIRSKSVAKSYQNFFESLWSVSKK